MEVRADSPPRVLADRYEVGELLGAGGMASVYRGHDRILQRPVAVKILDASLAVDDRFLRSFVREARAAAGLIHPNVVTVFDTGVDDDQHFILMELVEGSTLQQVLAREHRLEAERARRIAIDVARALTAAHGRGIVHRDVKPANVLMGEDGRPRVADFGIARPTDQDDESRVVFGTAAYLSPEQARGRPTTPASDVYSLGCVLYEMLTGRRPFTGDNPVSVAVKHLRYTAPPVEALAPDVPPALAAVVYRAMQKDPRRRFPDAGAMLAALEGAATVSGLPERRRPGFLRWAAASVSLAFIAVLAPALIGAGGDAPEPGARVIAEERGRSPARVDVPAVTGMSRQEAGRALRRADLIPIFRGAPLHQSASHVVATQDPQAGATLAVGSFVTLELVPADADVAPPAGNGPSGKRQGPSGSGKSAEGRSDETRPDASPSPSLSPTPSPSPTPTPTPSPSPTEGVR
ncbi:MAG TPA: protein kinase [Actinomycetota bacterium]